MLADKCIALLKRPDVKQEIKALFKPIIDLVLQEIYPYIYLSVLFVVISFLLILAIFLMSIRKANKMD